MKTIGVMIPTRNRVALLKSCLDSFEAKTQDKSVVELLIKVDEDDTETIEFLQNYQGTIERKVLVSARQYGYGSLHDFYNDLARSSSASHVLVFNDDCEMLTDGWEQKYNPYSGTHYIVGLRSLATGDSPEGRARGGKPFVIFDSGSNGYNGNPAIPRAFLDLFGTLSGHPMVDDWWHNVMATNKDALRWVDVDILFKRPDGQYSDGKADSTFTEGRQHINWSHHGSKALRDYTQNLRKHIDSNRHLFP